MNELTDQLSTAYSTTQGVGLAGLASSLRPDVVLHVPGRHALAGRHRGLEEIAGFLTASRQLTIDGEHVELVDTLVGASHIGMLVKVTAARQDGETLINHTIHLFAVDVDRRVSDIWLHNRDQADVDTFWTN